MKKVEKVSIGKCAFSLEEDAYILVKQYLNDLSQYYRQRTGGKEVMEGIEERMAELFIEKAGELGVVTKVIAVDTMNIIGKPEEIEDDKEEAPKNRVSYDTRRKLYRNPNHRILGGVCSGLAAYFNMDTLLMRILWVVLFFAVSSLARFGLSGWLVLIGYLVMWICVPAANTVLQKCEMRGEKISVDGIERNVERGAQGVSDRIDNCNSSNFWTIIGKVFRIAIGLILLLIGVAGLTGGIAGLLAFKISDNVAMININEWINAQDYLWNSVAPLIIFKISVLMAFFLPFIGCSYGGVMMLFNLKSPKWRPGLIIFILWLVAIITAGVLFWSATFWMY